MFAKCIAGITPAGAGKTFTAAKRTRLEQDHPRRCGENQAPPNKINNIVGSPPQVRGKLFLCLPAFADTGITPAGAGKTTCCGSAYCGS